MRTVGKSVTIIGAIIFIHDRMRVGIMAQACKRATL